MSRSLTLLLALGDIPDGFAEPDRTRLVAIAKALGKELCRVDARLLFGGRKGTLADIAIRALRDSTSSKYVLDHVSTYLPGDIQQSEIPRNDFVTHGTVITTEGLPEQRREALVHDCDAVVLMGTGRGIIEMARIGSGRSRFIIPIPCAGGPAVRIFSDFARGRLEDKQATGALRSLGDKRMRPRQIAKAVCHLVNRFAERRIGRGRVFLAMPFVRAFKERKAAENALSRVCGRLGLTVDIARDTIADRPLITEILARIDRAAVVVAYLDESRPNVYFELGHAFGRGKPTILCIKRSSEPAFDVQAFEQIRWHDASDLERKLQNRLKALIDSRLVIA
jgi:nucleoside 2-deoxyribosyltransferase